MVLSLLFMGEEKPAQDIQVDFTETVTVINLPLKVQQGGRPYKKLKKEELELVENGVAISLMDMAREEAPLTLHFLFDLSTSNERNIYLAKRAAGEMIQKMRRGDRVKISFFSSVYQPLTGYSSDRKYLNERLRFLTPVGSTALYDGIQSALEELGAESGSRALILFSDGHDLMSRTSEESLMTTVKNYRMPIFFVSFGDGAYKDKPLLAAQRQFMEELAAESGGQTIAGPQQSARILQRELTEYRLRYRLRFTPPGPEDVEQWRSLVVRVKGCEGCELEYRRAYKISSFR